MKERILL